MCGIKKNVCISIHLLGVILGSVPLSYSSVTVQERHDSLIFVRHSCGKGLNMTSLFCIESTSAQRHLLFRNVHKAFKLHKARCQFLTCFILCSFYTNIVKKMILPQNVVKP